MLCYLLLFSFFFFDALLCVTFQKDSILAVGGKLLLGSECFIFMCCNRQKKLEGIGPNVIKHLRSLSAKYVYTYTVYMFIFHSDDVGVLAVLSIHEYCEITVKKKYCCEYGVCFPCVCTSCA